MYGSALKCCNFSVESQLSIRKNCFAAYRPENTIKNVNSLFERRGYLVKRLSQLRFELDSIRFDSIRFDSIRFDSSSILFDLIRFDSIRARFDASSIRGSYKVIRAWLASGYNTIREWKKLNMFILSRMLESSSNRIELQLWQTLKIYNLHAAVKCSCVTF